MSRGGPYGGTAGHILCFACGLGRARAGGTNTTDLSSVSAVANQTYLVVGKVTLNSSPTTDQVQIQINPVSTTEPGTWDAEASSNLTVTDFDTLWFRDGNNQGVYDFDQIRLGTTYESVVVPEPATGLAALAGLLTLAGRRRR